MANPAPQKQQQLEEVLLGLSQQKKVDPAAKEQLDALLKFAHKLNANLIVYQALIRSGALESKRQGEVLSEAVTVVLDEYIKENDQLKKAATKDHRAQSSQDLGSHDPHKPRRP